MSLVVLEAKPPHQLLTVFVWLKAVANGPVDQVLAGTISQGKNKVPFYKKQVINKSTRVIFELV